MKRNFTFNSVPVIHRKRTSFPFKPTFRTTANIGELVPLPYIEILPGDSISTVLGMVSRATSPYLRPVMDNAFVDFHTFFVPTRLVWSDWEKFITGGDQPSTWEESFDGSIPCIPKGTVIPPNGVADALGYPVGVELGRDVSVLPLRAVALIYNEWFRDENLIESTYIQKGDYNADVEAPNANPWSFSNYTGKCPKVAKFRDYFTSALPAPQKGSPVSVGTLADGQLLPVRAVDKIVPNADTQEPIRLAGYPWWSPGYGGQIMSTYAPASATVSESDKLVTSVSSVYEESIDSGTVNDLKISNLFATVDGAIATSISEWRLAFQLQRLRERSARSGSRYVEWLLSAFSVESPDGRLQRPEFIGGRRLPLGYNQVTQTSQSSSDSVLGDVGAMGLSFGKSGFKKAFTEHGFLITFLSIRYKHSYQQGISASLARKKALDFYDPVFQHISEQPIYSTELFASASEDSVFGYKGAWDEYRYFPDMICKQMRSADAGGTVINQDLYHYGDVYASQPVLGQQFIEENPAFMGRTLAVDPVTSGQDPFMFDISFRGAIIRCMDPFSIPGLIDHD